MPARAHRALAAIGLLLALCNPTRGDATNDAVVEWVKSAAIPLKTVEAGKGFEDMRPIKAIVGNARIVSLGEPTHGSREVFQMKHRMLEFLASEMGFNLFGIEASMPDCIAINDYVLHGNGDPERAVAGQGFWTWSTEEVLDMVKWMRAYNEDPKNSGRPKLKFYGFDMQHEPSAVNAAMQYLAKVDPDAAAKFAPRVQGVFTARPLAGEMPPEQVEQLRAAMKEAGEYFDEQRDDFIAKTSADDYAMARRCVDVLLQCIELADESREQASSLGRAAEMQLFNSVPADSKELLAYLNEAFPRLAEESRKLLEAMGKPSQFAQWYSAASTTDEQRAAWQAQADKITSTLASATLVPGSDRKRNAAAQKQAENVTKLLQVLREYEAKPQRTTVENVRDRCMAENIAWILEQEGKDAKIVCWSHNGHAYMPRPRPGEGALAMGSYLEDKFGDEHVVIGFSFNQGSFQAIPGGNTGQFGLREWTVKPAKADSLDAMFARAGIGTFIIDFRSAPRGEVADWLAAPRQQRMTGALFDPSNEFYSTVVPSQQFDAMIFIDSTTRARPLKTGSFASMDPASVAMSKAPRLGVQLKQAEDGRGLLVDGVLPDTPAAGAGIKAGDRLLKVGQKSINSVNELRLSLVDFAESEMVPVSIERDGQEQIIEIRLRPVAR